MIRGIGIDMAQINEIERILHLESDADAFERRTFTEAERNAAQKVRNKSEYYATRFAAKEAVFKAIAHLLPTKGFDLRIVETLNHVDGAPYVNFTDELVSLLKKAGVEYIHISITTEADFATAFVVASA